MPDNLRKTLCCDEGRVLNEHFSQVAEVGAVCNGLEFFVVEEGVA